MLLDNPESGMYVKNKSGRVVQVPISLGEQLIASGGFIEASDSELIDLVKGKIKLSSEKKGFVEKKVVKIVDARDYIRTSTKG